MIRQLFYVSVAADTLSRADVQNVLMVSRFKNVRHDITGCLLHANGVFAQVLEGGAAAVTAVAEKIARDDRHFDVRVVLERDVSKRAYAGWSMGFVHDLRLEDEVHGLLAGAVDPAGAAVLMSRIRPDTVMGALA